MSCLSTQLPLALTTQLPYSASNFIDHAGVRRVRSECLEHLLSGHFRVCFVFGKARSGKTHLSIQLAEDVLARGIIPRLLEGVDELIACAQFTHPRALKKGDVCIVDEAEKHLSTVRPGQSGSFVCAVESLRVSAIPVIFLSAVPLEELPCDAHVLSRLRAGAGMAMQDPELGDMSALIAALARQRGLELREAHVEFLEKRLIRTIPAIERYMDRLVHLSRVLNRPLNFAVLGDACENDYDVKEIPS